MSRQEQKQLDREIPWREVAQLPKIEFDAFVKAAQKEFDGWMKWSGVIPLSHGEAKKILSDPKLRKRALKARAAYRDKARGVGPLQAKCRVVLIRCNDPDLRSLSRDAPTPSRVSEYVVMAVAASGSNRMLNGSKCRWFLWLSDAAQAFLQGKQDETERDGQLFRLPPDDPVLRAAGVFTSPL